MRESGKRLQKKIWRPWRRFERAFFARLNRFGARTCSFKPPRDAMGFDFGARSGRFFKVLPCEERAMRKSSGCVKTTLFTRFFPHRKLVAQAKRQQRRGQQDVKSRATNHCSRTTFAEDQGQTHAHRTHAQNTNAMSLLQRLQ